MMAERTRLHGLVKAIGNHTKLAARKMFTMFVENNRMPNGRSRDETGRFHGAPNYLDSRFVLRRQGVQNLRVAFGDECVRTMATVKPFLSNENLLVSPKTPT